MSWLYSRALVEAFLEATCLDGELSALSSGNPMPLAFLPPDRTKDFSRLSRSGVTFGHLTADRGQALLMWYLAGFPAKTLASRAREMGLTESGQDSGEKWRGWFVKYDPDMCLWKTAQCSLLEGLDEFSETWPNWGLMRDGACWEQMMSVPLTDASESGFWATPTTMDSLPPKSPQALMREATVARLGRSRPANLRDQVSNQHMWPTPAACMSKGSSPGALVRKSGRSRETDRLDHAVMAVDGGQLNPDWVEWLMGWPIGWTDLKPLGMDRFRQWQQQHGMYCEESEAA